MGSALKRSSSSVDKSINGDTNKKKFKSGTKINTEQIGEDEISSDQSESDVEFEDEDDLSGSSQFDQDESDELDELDDLDQQVVEQSLGNQQVGDDVEDQIAGEDPENFVNDSKSSAELRKEQKKLLAERKMNRKSGIAVHRIKSLWEKVRVKKPAMPADERNKLCDEIWELSNEVILDLVLKHDASRVVQTLVKFSSQERRETIVNALKGSYYQLATSSYGKYLLIKILHYGSKKSKAIIIDELHGKFRKLMRHREGAYVVEDLYVLYASEEQKKQIMREFWGSEYALFKDAGKGKSALELCRELAEKKQLLMKNLNETLVASVQKGSTGFQILHGVMREYIDILIDDLEMNESAIREFQDLLDEQVAELVHTSNGSDVACKLISLANAKERKIILKNLKSHSQELCKNEYGNSVLIATLMTVDDTVLVSKTFYPEILNDDLIGEIVTNKFSRRPLLYLLKGLDRRYFAPQMQLSLEQYEQLSTMKTSKKPQTQRKAELLAKALPLLYQTLLSTSKDNSLRDILLQNLGIQFVSELVTTPTDLDDVNNDLRPKLMAAVFDVLINGDILEDYHPINKAPHVSRFLKYMIQGTEFRWDGEQRKLQSLTDGVRIPSVGSDLAVKIWKHVQENDQLEKWCKGNPVFVVVALYEVLLLLEYKKEASQLDRQIKSLKKTLTKEDDKGVQLLLKISNH